MEKMDLNIKSDTSWKILSEKDLFSRLEDDPQYLANMEMARRVVCNVQTAVNHYLGPMSERILEELNRIMGRGVYGDYYCFLGRPFEEGRGTPHWHAVSLYKARDCSLVSYTSRISCRYFYKKAKEENKHEDEEVVFYENLLKCDQPEAVEEDDDNPDLLIVKKAFEQLSERDRTTIQCLVIDKMEGLTAFEELERFVHPRSGKGRTSEEIKRGWTTKQKQDVVSLMKGRALKHLLENFNELRLKTDGI